MGFWVPLQITEFGYRYGREYDYPSSDGSSDGSSGGSSGSGSSGSQLPPKKIAVVPAGVTPPKVCDCPPPADSFALKTEFASLVEVLTLLFPALILLSPFPLALLVRLPSLPLF